MDRSMLLRLDRIRQGLELAERYLEADENDSIEADALRLLVDDAGDKLTEIRELIETGQLVFRDTDE